MISPICLQWKNDTMFPNQDSRNVFALSAVELSDIDIILACIYRSPDSDFYEFLHRLALLFLKVSSKGKRLIFCGELNVIFLQYSGKLLDLQNLLLMNNLINIIKPQRSAPALNIPSATVGATLVVYTTRDTTASYKPRFCK